MRKFLTATTAALALAGTLVAAAAPADAQRWRGGYRGHYYRGGGSGAAVAAGILGLGIGAAIASDRYDRYDRYDRGYYRAPGYYYAPPAYGYYYYAPPPPPPPPVYYGYGRWYGGW
jgi:hypothetical protein